MPRDRDLKRIIRARMQKTGEAYTTARAHIIDSTDIAHAATPDAAASPDYAARAGRRDEIMVERTGRDWAAWVRLLDDAGAIELSHTDIARLVHEGHGIDGWWAQTVAVGYERIRGLREIGQRRSGTYEVSRSRTFGLPVESLYDTLADEDLRQAWLVGLEQSLRTATRPRSMRLGFPDGTIIVMGFEAKGAAKSTLSLSHTKLPDRSAADEAKEYWTQQLDELGALLGGRR